MPAPSKVCISDINHRSLLKYLNNLKNLRRKRLICFFYGRQLLVDQLRIIKAYTNQYLYQFFINKKHLIFQNKYKITNTDKNNTNHKNHNNNQLQKPITTKN